MLVPVTLKHFSNRCPISLQRTFTSTSFGILRKQLKVLSFKRTTDASDEQNQWTTPGWLY